MKVLSVDTKRENKRSGEPFLKRNKMYIFVKKETIIDNLINRRSRPYDEYKKNIIPKVMEIIKEKYPETYELVKDSKWSWKQNCGCSMCPCSPGFVASTEGNMNIFVDIEI